MSIAVRQNGQNYRKRQMPFNVSRRNVVKFSKIA